MAVPAEPSTRPQVRRPPAPTASGPDRPELHKPLADPGAAGAGSSAVSDVSPLGCGDRASHSAPAGSVSRMGAQVQQQSCRQSQRATFVLVLVLVLSLAFSRCAAGHRRSPAAAGVAPERPAPRPVGRCCWTGVRRRPPANGTAMSDQHQPGTTDAWTTKELGHGRADAMTPLNTAEHTSTDQPGPRSGHVLAWTTWVDLT